MSNAGRWPRDLGILISASALAVAIQSHAAEDDGFAKRAAADGYFEVQAAQLAQRNASSDQVKLLANKIAADHRQTNDQLRQIASMENVQLPKEPENKSELEKLASLKGSAFDKEYVRTMVDDHKKDIPAFMREAETGKDSAMKHFASQSLPMLQDHLHLAQQMQDQLIAKK